MIEAIRTRNAKREKMRQKLIDSMRNMRTRKPRSPEIEKQLEAIRKRIAMYAMQTYYFQSKRPEYFQQFLGEFPENVILVTTLETNRDDGYRSMVKGAPLPSQRYKQFLALDYPRKIVTIEPVMDFDLDVFVSWIVGVRPEYVWLGFNSRPTRVKLLEPPDDKFGQFATALVSAGIEVRGKVLGGLNIPGVIVTQ